MTGFEMGLHNRTDRGGKRRSLALAYLLPITVVFECTNQKTFARTSLEERLVAPVEVVLGDG